MIDRIRKQAGLCRIRKSGLLAVAISIGVFSSQLLAAPANTSSVDARLDRIERVLNNQNLLEMFTLMRELQREVSTLRGDVELLTHQLNKLKKQQKDIYIDLDQRIQSTDDAVSQLKVAPALPMAPSAGFAAGDSESGGDELAGDVEAEQAAFTEQEAYQQSFSILKSGKYEEAIESFQLYLITHPNSKLASNAQYWMAEAYYVLKDYQSAVSQFTKVVTAYPDSRKVSDAYLKIGFCFYELKRWTDAQQALEKVLSDFPNSTAKRLAQRRLEKMKLEGHI